MTPKEAFQRLYASGFEPRPGQIEMCETIVEAFRKREFAVLEGETGIGKTFAYLIAGLLALEPKQHLVIATATVTLQMQLFEKDLPRILDILELPLSATLVKGRQRYACPQKLLHIEQQTDFDLALMGIDANSTQSQDQRAALIELKQAFQARTWSGDLDTLSTPLPDALRKQITTDSPGCGQQKCQYFSACPYFDMKRAQTKSPILITNHHVLLSDIELGTGSLLPPPDKCLYIIDEAHQFPEAAIHFFQGTLHLTLGEKWLQGLKNSLDNLTGYFNDPPDALGEASTCTDRLLEAISTLLQQEDQRFVPLSHDDSRLRPLSAETAEWLGISRDHAQALYRQLGLLRRACLQEGALQQNPAFPKILEALGYATDRAQKSWKALHLLASPTHPPVAKWIQQTHKGDPTDRTLHASMTSSQYFLPELFWDKIQHGALLCSATLRAMDRFDFFLEHTGLHHYPNVITQRYRSGFAFENSFLNIPHMQHELTGSGLSEAYVKELTSILEKIFKQEQHGVLVLFTSTQLLEKVYDQMESAWRSQILPQTHFSRTELLTRHRRRVDQGKLSILFGLQSLSEGVDLPGNYCKHVVITRIPFAVPTTPFERTWVEHLEAQGKNAFYSHTLPRASVKLAQAVGRLIRTHSDTGTITLCDRRILHKPYGKTLLDTLPRFQRRTG